jgi:hypothetical protein
MKVKEKILLWSVISSPDAVDSGIFSALELDM